MEHLSLPLQRFSFKGWGMQVGEKIIVSFLKCLFISLCWVLVAARGILVVSCGSFVVVHGLSSCGVPTQ